VTSRLSVLNRVAREALQDKTLWHYICELILVRNLSNVLSQVARAALQPVAIWRHTCELIRVKSHFNVLKQVAREALQTVVRWRHTFEPILVRNPLNVRNEAATKSMLIGVGCNIIWNTLITDVSKGIDCHLFITTAMTTTTAPRVTHLTFVDFTFWNDFEFEMHLSLQCLCILLLCRDHSMWCVWTRQRRTPSSRACTCVSATTAPPWPRWSGVRCARWKSFASCDCCSCRVYIHFRYISIYYMTVHDGL